MTSETTYEIRPLTPETWPAVRRPRQRGTTASSAAAGASRSTPTAPSAARARRPTARSSSASSTRAGRTPRWSSTATRRSPGRSTAPPSSCRASTTASSTTPRRSADPDYRITCVFVDRRYRRQGLTEVAIRGALDLIAEAGGGVGRGLPARPDRADQEDVLVVPLQRHPPPLRAPRLHLRPPEGAEELRDGARGAAGADIRSHIPPRGISADHGHTAPTTTRTTRGAAPTRWPSRPPSTA